jgi:PBSX family phage portal protein
MPETVGVSTAAAAEEIVKARFIGTGRDGTEETHVLETPDEQRTLYAKAGAVTPPLDPVSLAHLFEMSGSLRSNIDAYSVNIDSFGHRFEPVIDLEADDAFDKVKLAMVQERMLGLDSNGNPVGVTDTDVEKVLSLVGKGVSGYQHGDRVDDPGTDLPEPTDAEVEARMASLRREMIRERLAVDKFFKFCTVDESFEKLRVITRQDLEATGNAYWEVLRNGENEIVQFNHAPGSSVRLMPCEHNPQKVEMDVRATLITPSKEPVYKRFRKYVQVAQGAIRGNNLVWFKEFGDPRIYSHLTGREYDTREALKREEPEASPATELIHFKIHNSRSVYGMPRWVSEMLAVIGSRHADEINLAYFENKSVPPMAILVSGGRLVQDDVTRLENYVKNEIRGKRNFHKIMILQAESGDNATPGLSTGRCKIELKPLTDAQNDDAQFMQYKEKNTDAIGSVFRLPRLLRGDARDFNRATAQTSLEFTEQQVFGPLRKDFDYFINRCLMPVLGINYWMFRSKGPDFSDPTKMLEAVNEAAKASYLTPEELRDLAGRGFNVDFAKLDQDWVTRPIQLTLGGITTGQVAPGDASASKEPKPGGAAKPTAGTEPEKAKDEDEDLRKEADRLVRLSKEFARREWEAIADADD